MNLRCKYSVAGKRDKGKWQVPGFNALEKLPPLCDDTTKFRAILVHVLGWPQPSCGIFVFVFVAEQDRDRDEAL